MQTEMEPEKAAVVAKLKYSAGLPRANPVSGAGPVLLVVRLVTPPCVTVLKVSVTGDVPVVVSVG